MKFIGLQPHDLAKLEQYRVDASKMPMYSSRFDTPEPSNAFGVSVNLKELTGTAYSHARADGRSVLSLPFNPSVNDPPNKRKLYEATVKDILEKREKSKSMSKPSREKLEITAIKRTWQLIAKREIPRMHKIYQKYKSDLDSNTKKWSQNCMKEVKKKASKTLKA